MLNFDPLEKEYNSFNFNNRWIIIFINNTDYFLFCAVNSQSNDFNKITYS